MNEFTNVVGATTGVVFPNGIYFQVVELIDGLVGQILFGAKPVYQTKPQTIKSPGDYDRLMTHLREHAVERLKVAFA